MAVFFSFSNAMSRYSLFEQLIGLAYYYQTYFSFIYWCDISLLGHVKKHHMLGHVLAFGLVQIEIFKKGIEFTCVIVHLVFHLFWFVGILGWIFSSEILVCVNLKGASI